MFCYSDNEQEADKVDHLPDRSIYWHRPRNKRSAYRLNYVS